MSRFHKMMLLFTIYIQCYTSLTTMTTIRQRDCTIDTPDKQATTRNHTNKCTCRYISEWGGRIFSFTWQIYVVMWWTLLLCGGYCCYVFVYVVIELSLSLFVQMIVYIFKSLIMLLRDWPCCYVIIFVNMWWFLIVWDGPCCHVIIFVDI